MNKIAIVGDSIVDEYYAVNAEKVSPEFPIPILQSQFCFPQKSLPGGAANVCYQLCNFDKDVSYFGFVDLESLSIFEDFFSVIDCVLLKDICCKIPRKKRFYQDQFPICRIDVESKNYNLSKDDLNHLQKKICKNLSNSNFDVVIFSDYGKGLFEDFEVFNYIKAAGNSIKIVDPKNGPASKWFGCDIIKPNFKEALQISGKSNWQDQAVFFRKETNAKAVIITQAGDGVVGMVGDNFFEYRPNKKIIPVSVVGAGDCFVSLIASCLLDGLSIKDSVEYAFFGSSLYVGNKYNKPIHPADLSKNKIVDPKVLSKRDFSLCFTNGCFDFGLTPAHIDLLRYAKTKKEKLVVALNSDLSVKKLKGEDRPFFNFKERADIISALDCVDYIVEFCEDTPINVINKIRPDLIVKGGDYKPEEVVGFGFFPVDIFEFRKCRSTTEKIIKFNE